MAPGASALLGRSVVETIVSVAARCLPPVATGLILLTVLSRRGIVGRLLADLGIEVVFTAKAVVLAMAAMGLPLLVRYCESRIRARRPAV